MKKKIICSVIFLFSLTICSAQVTEEKPEKNSKKTSAQSFDWKFGVSFTPALSWSAASKDIKSEGAGFAFDITVLGEKYFRERYAFYMGLSFVNMSGKFKNNSPSEIVLKSENLLLESQKSAKYSIQYLTIPVGLKFVTQQYGPLAYYFQGGLLPGIKVGSSISVENSEKQSFSKDLNLMTCGVQLSAGCLYPVANDNFVRVGLNFNHFFTDALNTANMRILPSSFGIVLGYIF